MDTEVKEVKEAGVEPTGSPQGAPIVYAYSVSPGLYAATVVQQMQTVPAAVNIADLVQRQLIMAYDVPTLNARCVSALISEYHLTQDAANAIVPSQMIWLGATSSMVTSWNGRTGAVAMTATDVDTALGYTPLPLSGGTLTGELTVQPPLMAGTAQAAAELINSTAVGSGTNGPATAQIGLDIVHQKQNYLTTSAVGEIDGIYVLTRQGGPGSDTGGVVVDVGNTGNGFSAILEGITTQMAPTTGVTQRAVRVQLGALNPQAPTYTGILLQAQNATSSQAILINDVAGQGQWTNFIEGWLSGSQNFVVTNTGAVSTSGGLYNRGPFVSIAPPIIGGTAYTVGANDFTLLIAGSGTMTLTLPTASANAGRILIIKNAVAFAVNSASANVFPFAGGSAGTAIMVAGPSKFCWLQCDGTSWQTMLAN